MSRNDKARLNHSSLHPFVDDTRNPIMRHKRHAYPLNINMIGALPRWDMAYNNHYHQYFHLSHCVPSDIMRPWYQRVQLVYRLAMTRHTTLSTVELDPAGPRPGISGSEYRRLQGCPLIELSCLSLTAPVQAVYRTFTPELSPCSSFHEATDCTKGLKASRG